MFSRLAFKPSTYKSFPRLRMQKTQMVPLFSTLATLSSPNVTFPPSNSMDLVKNDLLRVIWREQPLSRYNECVIH